MRRVLVYVSALAQHVHASHLRYKATGRVRDAEALYDRKFPRGMGFVELTPAGNPRLVSADESMCFNLRPEDEGRLFCYLKEST